MKKITSLILLTALVCSSCLSDLNLSPDDNFVIPGHWSAPIIKTRLNLGDMVTKDSMVTADPDGLVHIIYEVDSLFSQGVADFIEVPDQDPISMGLVVGQPAISVSTHLGTFGGAELKNMTIASGNLHWEAENLSSSAIQIRLIFLNTTNNGTVAEFLFDALPNGTSEGDISLVDLHFDLSQGSPAYNNLGLQLEVSNAGSAPNGTQVPISVQLQSLKFGQATGYFGQRVIQFPSGKIATNLGVIGNLSEGLYLANPIVKLYTKSNIVLPLNLAPNLLGIGQNGTSVDLKLEPFDFNGSTSPSTFIKDSIEVNTGNSDIDDFIANVPQELIYSGQIELNPDGKTGVDNTISNDGILDVGLKVDLPLELRTKNLTIEQHIYNVDFGVDDSLTDQIEEFELGFRVENGFPLDADLHIYFLDSTGMVLDSTTILIFDSAKVNANGDVVAPFKADRFYPFDKEDIQNILKCDDITIKVVLNTANNGTQVIRLLTEYYIDMTIGARVKMNLKP